MPAGVTLLALVALLWAPQAPCAVPATPNVRFETVSLEQGLSQATVQTLLQDRRGFIWIGTQEGLNRYDGYDVKVYTRDPDDEASLPNDWVWIVYEDPDGNLWIGTNGGGLGRYDPAIDGFVNYSDPESDTNDRVRALYATESETLWVGTDNGLKILNRETSTFTPYPLPGAPQDSGGDRIREIYEDGEGLLWVSTDGAGLVRIDPVSNEIQRFLHDPTDPQSVNSDRVRCVFEDRNGSLWIGLYDGGFDRLDRRTGIFSHQVHDADDPTSLPHNRVRAVLEEPNGDLWLATDGGLAKRSAETGRFVTFQHSSIDASSLSDNRVLGLLRDKGGVIWVATYAGASKQVEPAEQRVRPCSRRRADTRPTPRQRGQCPRRGPGRLAVGRDLRKRAQPTRRGKRQVRALHPRCRTSG